MTVTRLGRAPLRAIYITRSSRGEWYCCVAGYRPVADDTPSKPKFLHPDFEGALAEARELQHLIGIPIANGPPTPPPNPDLFD